jgi:hypothetical protein
MDNATQTEPAEGSEHGTENTEERERRARRTYPIQVFIGSAADGWKRVGDLTFNEERDALKWVRESGKDGSSYMLARVHLAQKIEPRKLVETEV